MNRTLKLIQLLSVVLLPVAAGYAGGHFTDAWIRAKKVPYPAELFNWAIAFGCFFLTLGVVLFIAASQRKSNSRS